MKILKGLSRKEYLSKFESKDHCLADTKWRVEYCTVVENVKTIGLVQEKKSTINVALDVDMTSLQLHILYFTKLRVCNSFK
jgi:hypothetical protein